MKKSLLFALIGAILLGPPSQAQVESLTEVFEVGKGLWDRDGDGLPDAVALRIVLPKNPTESQLAAASAVASRANFESLVTDFSLVTELEDPTEFEAGICPIFILSRERKIGRNHPSSIDSPRLEAGQGVVRLIQYRERPAILVAGGSDEALLKTARAFFLRWPYLWEVWGRENGITYVKLATELRGFLEEAGALPHDIRIREAFYTFLSETSPHESIRQLRFDRGEISRLTVILRFRDDEDRDRAHRALAGLGEAHARGERTERLSYPGCARIGMNLEGPGGTITAGLNRIGYPKRHLTPGFKSRSRVKPRKNDFDLTEFYTPRAAFSDSDQDQIPDRILTRVIAGPETGESGAYLLTSRLTMHTAGASFPLLYLDSEIEDPSTLEAAVLIGRNNHLLRELERKGKYKPPPLAAGQGAVQVIPAAFNPGNALAVIGADPLGLRKTLEYFSRTFPHLEKRSPGQPAVGDVLDAVEEFMEGKRGAAEALFSDRLRHRLEKIGDLDLESFHIRMRLPQKNQAFVDNLKQTAVTALRADLVDASAVELGEGDLVFSEKREFEWEGDAALKAVSGALEKVGGTGNPLSVSVGVSESPEVRAVLKRKIEALVRSCGHQTGGIEVHSAYKAGFFWIRERIIPRLKQTGARRVTIRFSREEDEFSRPKRFYTEPTRWFQELYPIDEIIAGETGIPLEAVTFEMKDPEEPIYSLIASDESGALLFEEEFSPRTRRIDYLKVLPEWGDVRTATGWVTVRDGRKILLDTALATDLERFWEFYQDRVLTELHSHILKKTARKPTFSKQPYFRQLKIDLRLSEPDFRLGLDEEIVSSLEAIHDELYFDTLDFLRGITREDPDRAKADERDTSDSRSSAPGNILPLIHPSLEGQSGSVEVTLRDRPPRFPRMELEWTPRGKPMEKETVTFPEIKRKPLRIPSLIFDGREGRLARLKIRAEIERETDYLALIDALAAHQALLRDEVLPPAFAYPGPAAFELDLKHKDMSRTYAIPVVAPAARGVPAPAETPPEPEIVPTDRIISPEMCMDLVGRLAGLGGIRAYTAGWSYEKRPVPVLEIFSPLDPSVSVARLITLKPTLYLSGRQHANEICATNYILKFAERLSADHVYRDYVKHINFVLHPMENPDGAALAFELQQLTPHHSLHAGRYSSLGIDVGSQVGVSRPLLPEALVRKTLSETWRPDIHLNLHGYPSHEWVQPFSGYSPFLFRDYWIPRGWFAYFRSVSLPIYEPFAKAGRDMRSFIVRAMTGETGIRDSNRRFYDRYRRWAARWQPHMNYLEEYNGVNLYIKRKSPRENRLSRRGQVTYIQETPELMDETARGPWLDFLCRQGLRYLKAHADYLRQAEFTISRIEEESDRRIHIQILRKRPGRLPDESPTPKAFEKRPSNW